MTRLLHGDYAELLAVRLLEHQGYMVWRTGGTAGVKTLRTGRVIPIRLGNDIFAAFDVLAVCPVDIRLVQVKALASYAGPGTAWEQRVLTLPLPANCHAEYWCLELAHGHWRQLRYGPDGTVTVLAQQVGLGVRRAR